MLCGPWRRTRYPRGLYDGLVPAPGEGSGPPGRRRAHTLTVIRSLAFAADRDVPGAGFSSLPSTIIRGNPHHSFLTLPAPDSSCCAPG
jgi:hypothetical protein